MTDLIRIGMIGAGHIARSHAACWKREAILTAVCSRQRRNAETLAGEFDIPVVCDEVGELIGRPDVDVVGITTPPHLHYPIAMQAMQAGKHVFCEKPLALSGQEARDMYTVAERTGVHTGLQAGLRQFKALRHLRQMILEGALGRVHAFHGLWSFDWARDPSFPLTWRFRQAESGTGALGDLGVYLIDAARWLIGEIISVCGEMKICITHRPLSEENLDFGTVRQRHQAGSLMVSGQQVVVENEDVCHILLKFENGVTGTIRSSRLSAGQEIRIDGEKASCIWRLKSNQLICYKAGGADYAEVPIPDIYPDESMVTTLLNNIRQNIKDPPTFYDGLKAQLVIDAVVQSDQEKRWIDVTN